MQPHEANKDRNSGLPELLTKAEAAAFLRIKPRTLDDWRASKALPCIERGRWIRFRRSDLERFLNAHTVIPLTGRATRVRRGRGV